MKSIQTVVSQLVCNLPREEMRWLLTSGQHVEFMSTRRAVMIISRVRLIAILFAAPDILMLPWPSMGLLQMARLYTSIAFLILAFSFRESNKMRDACMMIVAMFAIPTAFFAYSFFLLSQTNSFELAAFISRFYPFLPLVMVSGLSLFPLTVAEAAIFAAPVVVAEIMSSQMHFGLVNPLFSPIWLVFLIVIVATISGVSQLAFMISIGLTSFRDALTGCLARTSGIEMLGIQFTIASRSNSPLSIAFIDLDNFKSVNDKYGHDAGDQVLKMAAKHISSFLRTGDMLTRWGGEEFILIMPNTNIHQAMLAIERLRCKGLGSRPDNQRLTASIGISEWTEDQAGDWETMVAIADKRMYEAKKMGKDQMVYASDLSDFPIGKSGKLFTV